MARLAGAAWEVKSPEIMVAFIKKARVSYAGKPFKALEALRIEKRGEVFELSMAAAVCGAWMPWEAIGEPNYPSLALAKKAAREYAAAAPKA